MKGIFSGRQIRDLKGRGQKITRTQTAVQAFNAVVQKYGELQDSARYFHKGNGVWQKYSIENDSRRTGKIAPSRSAWEEQPHKLDWWGVDTKGDKQKRKFSVGQIKQPSMLKGKKSFLTVFPKELNHTKVVTLQRPIRVLMHGFNFKVGFTWVNNGNTYKIVAIVGTGENKNIKYINIAKPDKKYITTTRDLTFSLKMIGDMEKIKQKDIEKKAREAQTEAAEKKRKESEYREQINGLEGFETIVGAMRKPKVIQLLNEYVKRDGKITTRKDFINSKVKEGYTVGVTSWETSRKIMGERIGKTHTGKYLGKGRDQYIELPKTEYDFAEYLIKKRGIMPKFSVGQIKAQAKISNRKSKVLPKFSKKLAVKTMPVKVEVIPKPSQEKVSDFLYVGDIEGAKREYLRAYGHEYSKMPYTDPKMTKAFESFRNRTIQEWLAKAQEAFKLGRDLDVRLLFRGAWLAEGKPKDEKKIEAEYKKRFSNKKFL